MSQLSAKQLTLNYGKKTIVEQFNLTIPAEKITILVGANGSGKSTLLRGLARLLPPKQGNIYLDGKAIQKYSNQAIAKRLGILPQNPTAPEGLTVRDLVAQGRYPHQTWWQQWSKEDEYYVEKALQITGMQEFADRDLDTLSGGQRQRAWIAIALAQNTDILLLDEPTTFLDLAHQIEVLDLLFHLNCTEGKTIVMVLHELNLACRYADHLVTIKNGKLYSQGHPSEVMTQTMVADVFRLQAEIIPDPITHTPMCIPISQGDRQLVKDHQKY
ncbi:ABC transporter ATP-binding protein [Picosynechococcus sp. PCC 73109]|uniref:ABC transporter ATP-binding protein n=1 Tax=Picosynechococcus sp. PCC 73109 TaxID=374982 RepID=UPI0007458BD6|nr:ABC transporter ATP-binding protein [Picosynechococcus sp. PCC 73109]AMA10761.1 ABC transporter [Picosynechococcus sp. PCC 73109]